MAHEIIRLERDRDVDQDGSKLSRALAAHLAHQRAVRHRTLLVHVTALLAVPMWLAALLPALHTWLHATLGLFGGALAGSLGSLATEIRHRRAADRALAPRGPDRDTLPPP